MRILSVIATSLIILLGGCCTAVKLYDAEKYDSEPAQITAIDTHISNIDEEEVPPSRCANNSVFPGKHVVAARLDKSEYSGYGKRTHYYSDDLKVFFVAEAGHYYEIMPKLMKRKKWRLIIVDKNGSVPNADILSNNILNQNSKYRPNIRISDTNALSTFR